LYPEKNKNANKVINNGNALHRTNEDGEPTSSLTDEDYVLNQTTTSKQISEHNVCTIISLSM
jgi:hypothetical protein